MGEILCARRLLRFAAVAVAACSAGGAAEDGALVVPPAAPSASASARHTSLPPEKDPLWSEPEAPRPSGPNLPPEKGAAPGSTEETIACGMKRCAARKEICAYISLAAGLDCRPFPYDRSDLTKAQGIACDDASDCLAGETCCRRLSRNAGEDTVCVPTATAADVCEEESCAEGGGACLGGAACNVVANGVGACEVKKPARHATCAGGRRCPDDKPICAVSAVGPTCVAYGGSAFKAVASAHRYECTKHEDCGAGEVCVHVFGEGEHDVETYCTRPSPNMGNMLCSASDKAACNDDAACFRANCKFSEPKLPWMGTWVKEMWGCSCD